MPLNFLNSDVSRNCSGVSGGGSTASTGLTLMRHLHFLGELLVGETATNNLAHRKDEAVTVGHVPIVEPINFFVKVSEQVEWLDANVRCLECALQKTPEILKPIGVDTAVHVLNGVVNHLMLKLVEPVVRLQRIAIDARSGFHVLAYKRLKFRLAARAAYLRAYRTTAFQHCRYDGFAFRPASDDLLSTLVGVHVPRLAADEGFVNLNLAAQFVECLTLSRKADAVEHKPCRLLGYAKRAVKFPGRYTILAVKQHPNSRKPLLKCNWGILKDGSGFERERGAGVPCVALPHSAFCEVCDLLRSACGAFHIAARPTERNHELAAIFKAREVNNRIAEGSMVAHKTSMRLISWDVKYITAFVFLEPAEGFEPPTL